MYDVAKVSIRSARGSTPAVNVMEGVLQSEILSSLLFILFLSDIVVFFRGKGARGVDVSSLWDILMLLYADDLAVCAYSPVESSEETGHLF